MSASQPDLRAYKSKGMIRRQGQMAYILKELHGAPGVLTLVDARIVRPTIQCLETDRMSQSAFTHCRQKPKVS